MLISFKKKLFLSICLLPVKTVDRRMMDFIGPFGWDPTAHLPNRSKAVQVFRIVPQLKQAQNHQVCGDHGVFNLGGDDDHPTQVITNCGKIW